MTLPSTITTERLVLRPFEMRDLDAYVAYYTGPRTTGVGGPKPRYVVAERFQAMAGQWALRGYGRYAITDGQAAFGHAGIMHVDDGDPAEMTWTLWHTQWEGKGFATEACRAILTAWAGEPLVARIAPSNGRSIAMAQRLGFVEDPNAPPPSYDQTMRTYRQVAQ
ncbi:N-acetyltransferase [Jannaschia pagri]|uniref:N-acetyltransferase n=1 Tax=Jannaschia pagri TaxID=2829797 RepID=A0ABQ4NKS8_9RHOB|nr:MULTISPECIES: GNAT family N-acetyltransferase [unclassified Jannaschia]GIT91196.1 N-acetyltransferase [Jannaschia sp. AI_61]GIT95028.1 N-acetyltransferase [Jannaschia sp. AI_62]